MQTDEEFSVYTEEPSGVLVETGDFQCPHPSVGGPEGSRTALFPMQACMGYGLTSQ